MGHLKTPLVDQLPEPRRGGRHYTRASTASFAPASPAPGEIHAEEDDGAAHDLVHPELLAEEDDAQCNPGEGNEVLVDEHPVGADAADTPLPGCEGVGRREDRRERDGHPRAAVHRRPVQASEPGSGEQQDERCPEEHRVGSDRERGVALQQAHREHGVRPTVIAATRIKTSPTGLAPSAPASPSRKTTPTPTMERPTPSTPQRVGRSSPSTEPSSRPHTGAVAKTRPVFAVLVRLTP